MAEDYKVLSSKNEKEWRTYVEGMAMADITHFPDYCRVFEDYGNGVAQCFLFTSGDSVVAYPFILRPVVALSQYFDIVTPYGYGGYIWNSSSDVSELLREFRLRFAEYCETNNIVSEFVRFHPKHTDQDKSQEFFDSLTLHSWNPILDLTIDPEEQLSMYRAGHLSEIKKAEKAGLTFSLLNPRDHVDEFSELYSALMKHKGQKGYVNFRKEFFEVLVQNLGEMCILAGVFSQGRTVSMALFLRYGDYLDYFLSASNLEHYKLSGNHFMIHRMSEQFRNDGGKYFHLGGGHASLMYFKSGFSQLKKPFYIGRKIWNGDVYDQLTKEHFANKGEVWDGQNDYFPAYRRFEEGGR